MESSLTGHAEVLEVVDALGGFQLHGLESIDEGPAVTVRQAALERDVVVLRGPTREVFLVQARGEASLLGGGEDEGLVHSLDHHVGHALKVPRALAHLI